MQVQAIQSTNQNNNTFKARLINDKNGYLLRLWRYKNTEIDADFEKLVNQFKSSHKEHSIEITSLQRNEKDNVGLICEVFNHRTGATGRYFNYYSVKNLIKSILDDKKLFDESTKSAKLFQKLTGQKYEPDVTI